MANARTANKHRGTGGSQDLVTLSLVRRLLADGVARDARVGAGLSVREVARSAGVSPAGWSRWERGQRSPRAAAAMTAAPAIMDLLKAADLMAQGTDQ